MIVEKFRKDFRWRVKELVNFVLDFARDNKDAMSEDIEAEITEACDLIDDMVSDANRRSILTDEEWNVITGKTFLLLDWMSKKKESRENLRQD